MSEQNNDYKSDAMLEIRGNALRFVLPSGEYFYNRLSTVRLFVAGQLFSPVTGKPQKMLRSVKGDGEITPAPVQAERTKEDFDNEEGEAKAEEAKAEAVLEASV